MGLGRSADGEACGPKPALLGYETKCCAAIGEIWMARFVGDYQALFPLSGKCVRARSNDQKTSRCALWWSFHKKTTVDHNESW